MQKRTLQILLGVFAAAVIVFIAVTLTGKQPTTSTYSGMITQVSTSTDSLTIWSPERRTNIQMRLMDDTVFETAERKIEARYLRRGFKVQVDTVRQAKNQPLVARWVQVTQEPPVLVHTPLPNQAIASPVEIRGKARGTRYFEASFPVRITNSTGDVIARNSATADGNWMQEGFVAFESKLDFSNANNVGKSGTIVFEKANPSGRTENASRFSLPVRFVGTSTVDVFFGRDIVGTDVIDCSAVFGTERTIPKTKAVVRAALNELLEGPTEVEKKDSRYKTYIPKDVEIQRLELRDSTAYVDFNQALQEGVSGSCRVQAIRSQITRTLTQFPSVDDVEISINGETKGVLQP